MEQLRDYQHECLLALWNDLKESKTALACLPCGAGKTVIFKHLIKQLNVKTLVLFNKIDLVRQSALVIGECGIYCSGLNKKELDKKIVCASVKSLRGVNINDFELIIIDEVHNFNQKDGEFFNLLKSINDSVMVAGFTATPFNKSGYIYGKGKFFDKISYQKTLSYFLENNWLVTPVMKGSVESFDTSKLKIKMGEYDSKGLSDLSSDSRKAVKQVEDAMPKLIDRKKIVWSCCNITHAQIIFSILKSKEEMVSIVHSKMSREERDSNLLSFSNGTTRHLIFVTIVAEGYDSPNIDAVVLLRPTRSKRLYIQIVGRGLRPFGEKTECLVLDYGRVVEELGPIDDLTVGESNRSALKLSGPLMKFCKNCFTYMPIATMECPDCGFVYVKENDFEKNLVTKSSGARIISNNQIFTEELHKYLITDYTSKNGNECYLISYIYSLTEKPLKEYFLKNNEYALKKFQKRKFDLEYFQSNDMITFIKYKKEGKYNNIFSVYGEAT